MDFEIRNVTRATSIAHKAKRADSVLARTRGLMFEPSLPDGRALLIEPCSSVHMFWMRFPIDILYVSRDDVVVRVQRNLKPWRIGPLHTKNARYVVELPVGSIDRSMTAEGDQIVIEPAKVDQSTSA